MYIKLKKPTFTENDDFFYGASVHSALPIQTKWHIDEALCIKQVFQLQRELQKYKKRRITCGPFTLKKTNAKRTTNLSNSNSSQLLFWRGELSIKKKKTKFLANKWVIAVILHVAQNVILSKLKMLSLSQSVSQSLLFSLQIK